MDIFRLKKTYLSAKRLQEIINVFIKHGFGQLVDQLNLGKFVPFKKRIRVKDRWFSSPLSSVERLRIAFEELGPTFIKLGQLFASRPDLVGVGFASEFKKLQDKVPPFDVREVYEIIEKELSMKIDEIFQSFNPSPIGSASIAQVHEAVLKNGKEVIVKVRRPKLKEQITLDINILFGIARLMEKYIPESKMFDPTGIVAEFSKSILKEIDFRKECLNASVFRENFKDIEHIIIPKVYREFTTEKILIMERIRGERIDNTEYLVDKHINVERLLENLIYAYFLQIFKHGFFHGDPHPGNILVTEDGKVAFVDFGIVGRIDEDFIEAYTNVAIAIVNHDIELLITEYLKLGILSDEIDIENLRKELKREIDDILFPIYNYKLGEIQLSEIFDSIMKTAVKYRFRFLPELLLIDKVLIMLEGLTRQLCPNRSIMELIKPYVEELISSKVKLDFLLRKTQRLLNELRAAAENIPVQLKILLKKTVSDKLTFRMNITNINELVKDIDKASNKISFSLIVSSMILSSSIMYAFEVKPLIYGVSFFGVVTSVIAFLLGIWLIISIIRSGKL